MLDPVADHLRQTCFPILLGLMLGIALAMLGSA